MAAFAAAVLFIDKLKSREDEKPHVERDKPPVKLGAKYSNPHLLANGTALIIIILGLILTRSKGAFIGAFFAMSLLLIYHYFADRLKTHKNAVLVACLLLFVAGTGLVTLYGLKYNRLPGGGGMLVRWQYWHASVKMYADHPFTGVGPGNFTHFYPRYKQASALESVADPHNFLLSILTQYGPIGLAGFLAMILIPLLRAIFPAHVKDERREIPPSRGQACPAEAGTRVASHNIFNCHIGYPTFY